MNNTNPKWLMWMVGVAIIAALTLSLVASVQVYVEPTQSEMKVSSEVVTQTVLAKAPSASVAKAVAKSIEKSDVRTLVQAKVESDTASFNIDAMIGEFPYKNEEPSAFPEFVIADERKSIELYASSSTISKQVFDLAKYVGDIDRTMQKETVTKGKGFIRGYVYPQNQVVDWLNADYAKLDIDEKRMADNLIKVGVVQKKDGKFVWNPQYDGWQINGYSSAGTFRHERVHVLWLKYPAFATYFMKDWHTATDGMTKNEKIQYIMDTFSVVPYNRPPSLSWWSAVYDQVGEPNLVNEFTAHRIEKVPTWRGQSLAIAM